jgi:hypothetical protein
MRAPQEIAARAFALLAVAVRAESLNSGEPLAPQTLFQRLPAAQAALTPQERDFLADAQPSPEAIAKFGWRYEAVYLLEWALGLVDALPFPAAICDVPLTSCTGSCGRPRCRSNPCPQAWTAACSWNATTR